MDWKSDILKTMTIQEKYEKAMRFIEEISREDLVNGILDDNCIEFDRQTTELIKTHFDEKITNRAWHLLADLTD